jgi:hypothetical protein
MSFFPDMGGETMIAAGDHVRAIGWLHPDHEYPRGVVPAECVARLREFVRLAGHCAEALYLPLCMGFHTCEFCQQAHGIRNLGVPAGDVLFVAPEMVAHYVEQHGYAPPPEFVAAVMESPLPGTSEYQDAVERFRQIHLRQREERA